MKLAVFNAFIIYLFSCCLSKETNDRGYKRNSDTVPKSVQIVINPVNPWDPYQLHETFHITQHIANLRNKLSMLMYEFENGMVRIEDMNVIRDEILLEIDTIQNEYYPYSEGIKDEITLLISEMELLFDNLQSLEFTQNITTSSEFNAIHEKVMLDGFTDANYQDMMKLAESNDSSALLSIGEYLLFNGSSGTLNLTTALTYFTRSALLGNNNARAYLGLMTSTRLFDHSLQKVLSSYSLNISEVEGSYLLEASNTGNYVAKLAMGYRYAYGVGGAVQDCQSALKQYSDCAAEAIRMITSSGSEKRSKALHLSSFWRNPLLAKQLQESSGNIDYYHELADNGMSPLAAEAANQLGDMYFFGDARNHVQPDQQLAVQYFTQAADGGIAQAQANLGLLHANGIIVEQNNETALKYFKLAAKQKNGLALNGLGFLYLNGMGVEQNVSKAIEYFQSAADEGFAVAHNYLGAAYLQGGGVEVNYTKSIHHFRKAAEADCTQAMFNLGILQTNGWGTPSNCEAAVENFREVSFRGLAMIDLPFSSEMGYECYEEEDYPRALLHYSMAAAYGDAVAQANAAFLLERNVGLLSCDLPDSEIQSTSVYRRRWELSKAHELYSAAAAQNSSEGLRKVGDCMLIPWLGVCSQDLEKAADHYSRAADLGDPEAMHTYGRLSQEGVGMDKSIFIARQFFEKCSKKDFPYNAPCAIELFLLDIQSIYTSIYPSSTRIDGNIALLIFLFPLIFMCLSAVFVYVCINPSYDAAEEHSEDDDQQEEEIEVEHR